MKTFSRLSIFVLMFSFVGIASASTLTGPVPSADEAKVNWKQYSRAVVDGLRSENNGIRDSAMRMAIRYADNLDISNATIDLMRIYRNAENPQVRRMAAVALSSIDSALVDGYLRNSESFEKSDSVRKTLRALSVM